jgi:PAS domain S-box-containing protein
LVELNEVIAQLQSEIEQRQQVEAALIEREEQYRSVVDNVKEVIFQMDAKGLWTFLNPAWSEITGFAIADSLGHLFLDYVHPEDRQRSREEFRPLIEGKKEYCRHEVRYLTRSGGYRWIEVLAQLTVDADGIIIGTCGTLNDITERHLSEATLRKSEERFRSLVANIPGVVYRCAYDADRTMKFISDAIKEISGYPAADFMHNHVRTFASLIEPQDIARVQSDSIRVCSSKTALCAGVQDYLCRRQYEMGLRQRSRNI